ncbi:hypothetical protein BCD_1464 (plasmid) [Borrelia crocidurae DOU]|uniref:Uncharacterized protein n=1 Tax=Borrelia crocidurae DOU TaxID=1293575 RepID=W5SKX3_9SPIR|nr:hypothetical protein BCD_1464 [Borrelia crocidurae DOU]
MLFLLYSYLLQPYNLTKINFNLHKKYNKILNFPSLKGYFESNSDNLEQFKDQTSSNCEIVE